MSDEINNGNATVIYTDGDSLYEKALYITSDKNLEISDYITISKELHSGKMMIRWDTRDASYLAIGRDERRKIAEWLLDGIDD